MTFKSHVFTLAGEWFITCPFCYVWNFRFVTVLDSKAAGECLITLEKGNYQTLYAPIPALAFGLMGARLKYLFIIVNRKNIFLLVFKFIVV